MRALLMMTGTGSFPPGMSFVMPPPGITAIATAESHIMASEKRVTRQVAEAKFP
jgi:hypothetical protein